tara:strand:+ start:317 stop:829 length:513 start_codon:yes stop_codon:yes gene_type:complete
MAVKKSTDKSKKMGRPTLYSEAVADMICEVIERDGRSMQELCDEYSFFPAKKGSIYAWSNKHKYFNDRFLRATRVQMHVRLDDIDHWINSNKQDFAEDKNGRLIQNNGFANRLRAKMHFGMWRASKLLRETYGDTKVDDIEEMKTKFGEVEALVKKSKAKLYAVINSDKK